MCWLQVVTPLPCKMDTLVLRSVCTIIALCASRCVSCAPPYIAYNNNPSRLDVGKLFCLTSLVIFFLMLSGSH